MLLFNLPAKWWYIYSKFPLHIWARQKKNTLHSWIRFLFKPHVNPVHTSILPSLSSSSPLQLSSGLQTSSANRSQKSHTEHFHFNPEQQDAETLLEQRFTYLDVLLSVDVHVDERAEPNQTLPHLHVALPEGQNEWMKCHYHVSHEEYLKYTCPVGSTSCSLESLPLI